MAPDVVDYLEPVDCRLHDEADRSTFMYGGCFSFALALQAWHPELSIGILYQGKPSSGSYSWHAICHDADHAYDAEGAHPLKELTGGASSSALGLSADEALKKLSGDGDGEYNKEAYEYALELLEDA
jgi:hypothetical protein